VLNRKLQGSHRKLLANLGDTDLDAAFRLRRSGPSGNVLTADLPEHPDERLLAFRHLLQEYGLEAIIPVRLRRAGPAAQPAPVD